MPITKEFYVDLDLKTATGNRDFTLVEGDTGNVIHVTLKDDGAPVDLRGCRVLAVFTKPTGSSMQDSAIEGGGVSIGGDSGNEVTISLYAASFGTGTNACELQIYSGEERNVLVTSAAFNFYCRNGIIDDDTIRATDEYPLLTSLIAQVQAIAESPHTPASIGAAPALQSSVTYHVAMTGNDTTGDGTSGSPFASVTKALSLIPKNMNGFNATINVGDGVYAEYVEISSFNSGGLVIDGTGAAFPKLSCSRCSAYITLKLGALVYNPSAVTYADFEPLLGVSACLGVTVTIGTFSGNRNSPKIVGVQAAFGSFANLTGTTVFTNCYSCVRSISGSTLVNSGYTTGSASNDILYQGSAGNLVVVRVPDAGHATTLYSTSNGGRIYAGAQTSAPNY